MLLVLIMLACVPLLAVEPLRWHHRAEDVHCLNKAFCLMSSASVFWALLADYVSTVEPGWHWFFYAVLVVGAALMGFVSGHHYAHHRRRYALLAVPAFILIFSLTAWLVPDSVWYALRENVAAMGPLSHFRGPLR